MRFIYSSSVQRRRQRNYVHQFYNIFEAGYEGFKKISLKTLPSLSFVFHLISVRYPSIIFPSVSHLYIL
jgi:hypothetical protein